MTASPSVVDAVPSNPSPEFLRELAEASKLLETAHPRDVIRYASERYFPKLTMATAFGAEGCVILHFLAEVNPKVHVFNLDTGYQFPETLRLRDEIAARYGIEVELKRPAKSTADYEAPHALPLYKTNPDQCCNDRKLVVLKQAALGWDAWMSAIRRDQSEHRANAPIIGWDKKFGLVKINPLANWTKKNVWDLIVKENVPYNPLYDDGYTSIGCWPCTKRVGMGEDERAGRWSGFGKTECGLHTTDDVKPEETKPEPPQNGEQSQDGGQSQNGEQPKPSNGDQPNEGDGAGNVNL